MNAAPAPANLSCPRCGYAFRGEHESWSNAWPLEGRCAECGLSFLWRDIFNPQFGTPRWLVEARSTGLIPWRRAVGTLFRSCIPSYFWQRVSLNHPIRRKPLFGFLALLWIPVFVLGVAAHVIMVHTYLVNLTVWYSVVIVDPAETTLQILTHPWSDEPIETLARTNGLFSEALSPRSINLGVWAERGIGELLMIIMAMPLITAMAFVALPVSRRRARVRRAHVMRITAYAYALLSLPIGATLLPLAALFSIDRRLAMQLSSTITIFCIPLGGLFALWWWHAAIRRYLRMQHSIAVALSVWIIGTLTPIVGSVIIWYLTTPD